MQSEQELHRERFKNALWQVEEKFGVSGIYDRCEFIIIDNELKIAFDLGGNHSKELEDAVHVLFYQWEPRG